MNKLWAVGLCAIFAVGCGETDPNKPGYWVGKLTSKRIQDRIEACNRLRKFKDVQDAPKVAALLKDEDPRVREAAAEAVGTLGDKSTVPQLADAIDFTVGAGSDRESRAINEANKQIAMALGELDDKRAVPALIKLTRSHETYVKLEAVRSLGELRDPGAVDTLMDIATDDNTEPFIAKKAIIALGKIGDPKAVPAIERMLFKERKGISFYAESSYAVFEIGDAATTPLLALLDGKDPAMEKWAEENHILPEALYAKTAQVLGDIGDRRAVKGLMEKLNYSGGDFQLLVRSAAAESLGRMRVKEAAEPIAKLMDEDEANIREAYGRALVMIGDPKVLPQMVAAAQKGSWDAREATLHAVSNLGGAKELVEVQKIADGEQARWMKECTGNDNSAEDCQKVWPKHKDILDQHLARLKAAGECADKEPCWTAKLKDPSGPVRERAAWELGRMDKPDAIQPLLTALQDDFLAARYAECLALGWLLEGAGGKPQMKQADERVEAILTSDEGKTYYIRVDEDLKRLANRLEKDLPREAPKAT
jgi:HEAT repeat protein